MIEREKCKTNVNKTNQAFILKRRKKKKWGEDRAKSQLGREKNKKEEEIEV